MRNDSRKYVVLLIFISITVIFIFRLFYMQLVDDTWKMKAAVMSERKIHEYPSRGLIYDRNGKLLVTNKAVYDLMILPKDVKLTDTLAFCQLVDITVEDFRAMYKKACTHPNARYKPSVFIKQIPPDQYAPISEELHKYKGFYGMARTLRNYPNEAGALLLGDIGEAGQVDLDRDPYYRPGDYIGKGGLEKTYEPELRGRRGVRYVLVDALNNIQGSFAEGVYDTLAISGSDLICTIDADLQAYGERLMQNKKGSIVAIEPATGEILCMVSSPGYNPNLLVGRDRGKNFAQLLADPSKPLYNRATLGQYRPGSIFKMVQALVAMELGAIGPETRLPCNRSLIGCHGGHSYEDLNGAIVHSCNPYFYQVFKKVVESGKHKSRFQDARIGLAAWKEHIESFGFGTNLRTDIPDVKIGNIPGPEYYDRIYKGGSWAFSTIYSISIGEGELLVSPMQMANLAAVIANRGSFYFPHTVKDIEGSGPRELYAQKQYAKVATEKFNVVAEAMHRVVEQGTGRQAKIPGIEVCGKTGTVENKKTPDHSVFIAFAPKENPRIAIATYVEYAGWGGSWAAPICALMIEKYLTGEVKDTKREERILDAKFLDY
jgi:penicillin-binding protein 2